MNHINTPYFTGPAGVYYYLRRFFSQCDMRLDMTAFWELDSSYCLDRLIVNLERRWE